MRRAFWSVYRLKEPSALKPRQPRSGTFLETVPAHSPPSPGMHPEPVLRPAYFPLVIGLSKYSPHSVEPPVQLRVWPCTFVLMHAVSLWQNWPPPSPLRCTIVVMP